MRFTLGITGLLPRFEGRLFSVTQVERGKPAPDIYLFVAKTSSLAGNLQIVARSVETAMHKLHALEFDLSQVRSGRGVAPLPPVAKNDVQGIGRTNDAILYGSSVTLWIDAPQAALAEIAEKVPSCSSAEYGRPFEEILQGGQFDFYQIDPLLFSPAEIHLVSLRDGTISTAGRVDHDLLAKSFG
jgi:methenyltetrahydromethanopterin cyclohydrolase